MTDKEKLFDMVVQETVQSCLTTLVEKGKEYRREGNPFHNFEKGVMIDSHIHKTREEVIWGFALKHFISIQDMRVDVKNGKFPKLEVINEKFGDLINYLLIEKASIVDKINNQSETIRICEGQKLIPKNEPLDKMPSWYYLQNRRKV